MAAFFVEGPTPRKLPDHPVKCDSPRNQFAAYVRTDISGSALGSRQGAIAIAPRRSRAETGDLRGVARGGRHPAQASPQLHERELSRHGGALNMCRSNGECAGVRD